MRVFAIKDESLSPSLILGFLIYYENAKAFYIELPEDADPWHTPLLLDSFVKRGEKSVGSYWSRIWVEQRIIPQDRQNIGQVLKENGLDEYDEFSLLMLSQGRCAQDQCYLEELSCAELPETLKQRWKHKIEDVVPLDNARLLTFFRDGKVKIVDTHELLDKAPACAAYIGNEVRFNQVEVQPDGYGVRWSEQAVISDHDLYSAGVDIPLSLRDFCRFVQVRVINATEACQLLDCSRQNIDDLVKRNKLHPIRTESKHKLFLRNEVVQRKKG